METRKEEDRKNQDARKNQDRVKQDDRTNEDRNGQDDRKNEDRNNQDRSRITVSVKSGGSIDCEYKGSFLLIRRPGVFDG